MKEIKLSEIYNLKKPVFILTMGPPGCGKSTFIKKHFATWFRLDVDEIITELGGGIYKRELLSKGLDFMKKTLKTRYGSHENTIVVSTSSFYSPLAERLQTAHKLGFSTVLVYFDVFPEICQQRNRNRITLGEKSLPLDKEWKIEKSYNKIKENFKLLESGEFENIDYILKITE